MKHCIGFGITLRPRSKAGEFEASFGRAVRTARKQSQLLKDSQFLLYRPVGARNEYIWITRFPAKEFQRVNRAAIPFILFVILKVFKELSSQGVSNIHAFSAPFKGPQSLVEEWNKEFGRFAKLSLDTPE